jgi:drug/metabolite transporter (DMT)-like permease
VVLSGILYGFLGYFGVHLFAEKFTVPSMLFWRFLIAGIWMVALSWRRMAPSLAVARGQPLQLGLCSMYYGVGTMFYFVATRTAGTGLAMVVFFAYPIFVALHTYYNNGWQVSKTSIASLSALVVGLALLVDHGGNNPNTIGIVFALLSAVGYALYLIASKRVLANMTRLDLSVYTAIVCMGSALIFLIASLIDGALSLPTSVKAAVHLLGIGIFATAIPIQLLLEGLKKISTLKASMASVLEPAVTLLVGVSLLDESISSLQIVGISTVLGSSLLIQAVRD